MPQTLWVGRDFQETHFFIKRDKKQGQCNKLASITINNNQSIRINKNQ